MLDPATMGRRDRPALPPGGSTFKTSAPRSASSRVTASASPSHRSSTRRSASSTPARLVGCPCDGGWRLVSETRAASRVAGRIGRMSEDAAVVPQPHPLVGQLSALHHFHTYIDIAVVVVVLAITNLVAHFTTPWASIATVPAAAVGLLILVRSRGLGWTELGLGRDHWKSGAGYALAAVAVVMTVIAIGALLPWTRPMFMNNNYATVSGALIASMIIIPLQTVIPEELAFRGVLHGALNRAWGFRGVAAGGSLLFGLWHIATSFGLTSSNVGFTRHLRRGPARHDRRCGARRCRDRRGRFRVHLAAPSQRQPVRARSHCTGRSTASVRSRRRWCGTCQRDRDAALAGAELAVLEFVSARRHVAPGAAVIAGPVVERPLTLVVPAGLEPRPGAVPLGVADDQQQLDQAALTRNRRRRQHDLAVVVEVGARGAVGRDLAQRRQAPGSGPGRLRCGRASRADASRTPRRSSRSAACSSGVGAPAVRSPPARVARRPDRQGGRARRAARRC